MHEAHASHTAGGDGRPPHLARIVVQAATDRYDYYYPTFYFSDPDGDADTIHRRIVSVKGKLPTFNPTARFEIDPELQKKGTDLVGGWACGPEPLTARVEAFLTDRQGHRSNTLAYTVHCRGAAALENPIDVHAVLVPPQSGAGSGFVRWDKAPTLAELRAASPTGLVGRGTVNLTCDLDPAGRLRACKATDQAPADIKFDRAIKTLVPKFRAARDYASIARRARAKVSFSLAFERAAEETRPSPPARQPQ